MKRHAVVILPRAEEDIAEIARYIAEDSPANALRFAERLHACIASLDQLPERGAGALEGSVNGVRLRQLVNGAYRIIYSVEERQVFVHGVRHTKRLPE